MSTAVRAAQQPSPPPKAADGRHVRTKISKQVAYMDAQTLAQAGAAVTRIGKIWRGIRTRRQLKARLLLEEYRKKKYVHVQCFFRCVQARRIRSQKRARVVQRLDSISARYNEERVKEFNERIRWDWKSIERAAVKVQRWYRWLRTCRQLLADGTPREQLPLMNAEHHQTKKKKWLEESRPTDNRAWAPRAAKNPNPSTSRELEVVPSPPSPHRRRLRDVDLERGPVYTDEEILYMNNAMRSKERAKEDRVRSSRPLREPHNQLAVVSRDLDHCAALVQRRFRLNRSADDVSSRREFAAYQRKHAIVIQCAWRSYMGRTRRKQLRRLRDAKLRQVNRVFADQQIARVDIEAKWNRFTLDRAAMVIQRAFRWTRGGKAQKELTPPYGLLAGTRMKTKRRRIPKAVADVPPASEEERAAKERFLEEERRLEELEREQQRRDEAAAEGREDGSAAPPPPAGSNESGTRTETKHDESPSKPPATTPGAAPPSLAEGRAALSRLDQRGVQEIRYYVQPPRMVRAVVEAALAAIGNAAAGAGDWSAARDAMRAENFVARLRAVEPAEIATSDKDVIKRVTGAPEFSIHGVKRASVAAGHLAVWIVSVARAL